MTRGVLLLALGCMGACACGQVTKTRGGYLLRVHYTKGMVIRDAMTNSVSGLAGPGGAPLKFTVPITVRVLDATSAQAKLQIEMGAVKFGTSMSYPGAKAAVTINNRNQAVGDGAGPPATAELPERAVRVGDTWTAKVAISTGLGQSTLTGTYKFVGIRLTGGPPVAVISFKLSGTAKGSGTETLLIKDGTVYNSSADIALSLGAAIGGAGGSTGHTAGSDIHVHYALKRL
jgi:hypothetical protein